MAARRGQRGLRRDLPGHFRSLLACARGGFIWDDDAHVTPAMLRSLHGLWRIWFQPGATQQYYPLLHSAFWVEHRLWGGAPLGYHLRNILRVLLAGENRLPEAVTRYEQALRLSPDDAEVHYNLGLALRALG